MTSYSKKSAGQPVQKMADGGSVGFFERLRAGNIDDTSSEAYKRWGAGSKRSADPDTPVEAPAPSPAPSPESNSSSDTEPVSSSETESDGNDSRFSRQSGPTPVGKSAQRKAAPKPAPNPVKRGGGSEPDYGNEGRKSLDKSKMFGESRAATKRFDEGVKAAAIRNRESAAEVTREQRRKPAKPDAPQRKGTLRKIDVVDSYANGGLVKAYGKK